LAPIKSLAKRQHIQQQLFQRLRAAAMISRTRENRNGIAQSLLIYPPPGANP